MDSTDGHDEHVGQTGQKQEFSRLLRRYRLAAGWTQEQLAEHAGVCVRSISNLERGSKHIPRGDTIRMIATVLDLNDEQAKAFMAAARARDDGEPIAAFALVSGVSSLEARHSLPASLPAPRDAMREAAFGYKFLRAIGRLLGGGLSSNTSSGHIVGVRRSRP